MIDDEQVEEIGDQLIFEILGEGIDILAVTELLYEQDVEDDDNNSIARKVFDYVNGSLETISQRWEDRNS